MKTDLTKILSISGRSGLFRYLAQARSGAIVESLSDGKRSMADAKSRITTLADISIYSSDGEIKLQDVLLKMKEVLADADAPSSKADSSELKTLFSKAVPAYDETRFYVSHMRKIVEWYNELKNHASFDFEDPDKEAATDGDSSSESEDKANE